VRIQSVTLKDGQTLGFGDFNVVIGGNAVGKTTLLLQIFSLADDKARLRWYWFNPGSVKYSSEDALADLKLLMDSMSTHVDGANRFYYSQSARNLEGKVDLDSRYRLSRTDHEKLESTIGKGEREEAEALINQLKYRRAFLFFASCEGRLTLPNQTALTQLSQAPQDALNVLYRNPALTKRIDQKVLEQFGFHLALLDHARSQLDMGLSREEPPSFDDNVDDRQEEFQRIEDWKEESFVSIQNAGHGIRSMVNLLMSLLDPVNQIVLIDEPELFIYPAQKRWLGKQLVNLAREQRKQAFLVTHDPIVLQGILDSPGKTRVLRIHVDDGGIHKLRQCDLTNLDDIGAKRNQDSYLQGLFYQRDVAVEGATDRAFYQIMVEELMANRIENKDLGFVACGGKGASKNVAFITSQVGLRSAFIYDFDALLFDIPLLHGVVQMLAGKSERLDMLASFLQEKFGGDEKKTREGTGNATKHGMKSDFVRHHRKYFEEAMDELSEVGIFILPFGSLESWAPEVEPKARFAESAPDTIKPQKALSEPLEAFLDKVLRFVGC
jgi:hypothetical protein